MTPTIYALLRSQEANVNGMELKEGKGGEYEGGLFGKPKEDDLVNLVWVVSPVFSRFAKRAPVRLSSTYQNPRVDPLAASYFILRLTATSCPFTKPSNTISSTTDLAKPSPRSGWA